MHTMMILFAALPFVAPELPNSHELLVERAARQFRIHAYDTYRTDRETYDQFLQAGDELLANWRDAGKPSDHRDEVLAWYQGATPITLAASLPPMPALPMSVKPEPDATVDLIPHDSVDPNPRTEAQSVTPLPIESGEVLFQSTEQTDDPGVRLPISTSAAPLEKDVRTPAEMWSDSPKMIMTLGKVALGIAGF
jgi:hypothetical protein